MSLKFDNLLNAPGKTVNIDHINSDEVNTSKYFHTEEDENNTGKDFILTKSSIEKKKKRPNCKEIIQTNSNDSKLNFSTNYIQLNNKLSNYSPSNWKQQLLNIRHMRQYSTAAVDKMGSHMCADKSVEKSVYRFQILLALILSSQTKDEVTYMVMKRLKQINCVPKNIATLSDEELGKLIYPVSFWKRKVQYLKKTSRILLDKYKGDIPKNVKDLCDLPGVGPKIAHICMQISWNEITGIGVDTHVHRISNRLKWVPEMTKTPEETRKFLESWLPRELWFEINILLVGFGQEICRPQRPKCSECINKGLCPYAKTIYQF